MQIPMSTPTISLYANFTAVKPGVNMASFLPCRSLIHAYMRPVSRFNISRTLTTVAPPKPASSSISASDLTPNLTSGPSQSTSSAQDTQNAPNTHFKITLRRSAISLGDRIKGTLKALGIHRRFQTVYFPHSPEVAGKILRVKELVEVENVPTHLVMTKQQQRQARKAPRGYKVVGSRRGKFINV